MKKLDKKGFTLAELLIVVAIIAVLVAIAIPIFTKQLEKSRENTDLANLRAAYAAATVAAMDGKVSGTDIDESKTYYYNPGVDGSISDAGIELGQGTATDGGSNVDAIKAYSDYVVGTEARNKKIEITFKDGVVNKINFESSGGAGGGGNPTPTPDPDPDNP